MTTSRDNLPERTLPPRLMEAWRRWGVVHAATEREHATELAVFPDLLHVPVQPAVAEAPAPQAAAEKFPPVADAAISLAAQSEAAEVAHLAMLRERIDGLAA